MEKRLKTYIMAILFGACLFVLPGQGLAQSWKKTMNAGDAAYSNGDFAKADSLYRLGQSTGANSGNAQFNRGDALYRNGNVDEALGAFKEAVQSTDDPVEKAEALHNMGNALLQKQDAAGAIEAYKQALRLNPNDEDTRHNLAFALRQQEQQQEQQNQDQENQDQQNQDQENQDQQNQDQQNQDQENQDQQNQDSKEPKEGDEKQDGQPIPYQLSKEEAERMLEALNQKEKEIQQNLKKEKNAGKRKKIEKDW